MIVTMPDTTPRPTPGLAVASLALAVAAMFLAFTLPRYQAPWALAAAIAAVVLGVFHRGTAGVWVARTGVTIGLAAAIFVIVWLSA